MRSSSTKNVVFILIVLVTWEDLGNVASSLEILKGSASTSSSAQSSVRQSLAGALSDGLGGVTECVTDCSVDENGA